MSEETFKKQCERCFDIMELKENEWETVKLCPNCNEWYEIC